jgi:GNAT superfamily N-acetyltransferase
MTPGRDAGPVTIRPAVDADVETLDAITVATEDTGEGPPSVVGIHVAYLRHLVARGGVAVAVDDATGETIGFGATVDTGRARHLADLFVLPGRQAGGVGGRLLATVFADAWPRTTFASDDPRALPLYVRAGMTAHWPNLYLSGEPKRLAAVVGYAAEPASIETVADLQAGWAGVDRRPDLGYWAQLDGVRPFVVRHDGEPVAAGVGRTRVRGTGRWIHGAVAAPDADGPAALLTAMAYGLAGSPEGGACVPGPSPLVRQLLDAGYRIVDRDTFMATEPTLVDPLRELVDTGIL